MSNDDTGKWPLRRVLNVRRYNNGPFHAWELECGHARLWRIHGSAWEAYEPLCVRENRRCRCQGCFEEAQRGMMSEDNKHKNAPKLPEGWCWTTCERCGCPWLVEGPGDVGVYAVIGEHGIEVHVMPHPPDMDGSDPHEFNIPWTVLLAVKDRAIAEAHSPEEELRARAADLRPEDRFVTGNQVRYVGNRSETRVVPDKKIGAIGTVTGYSTPKHGHEHVKQQSVLVTWDEGSARPGIPIEGRETMIESIDLEAVEVH